MFLSISPTSAAVARPTGDSATAIASSATPIAAGIRPKVKNPKNSRPTMPTLQMGTTNRKKPAAGIARNTMGGTIANTTAATNPNNTSRKYRFIKRSPVPWTDPRSYHGGINFYEIGRVEAYGSD